MESQTIRHMIEDNCADGIPLPNVNSKILSKVIEYCNKHVHAAAAASKAGSDDAGATATNSTAASGEDHKNWDADFVKVDKATLFDLILLLLHPRRHGPSPDATQASAVQPSVAQASVTLLLLAIVT
ncbi:hypothetical protein SEVIR_5G177650v4 [Setaria viridis]|uniref:SKP1 component POZ domain-containing protein n=1 Tax=Setaria viridis TaxID=4556 RepID=A0A4U6UEY1_SETVI|nr:SKP1-like protein 1 isoform X1 [Setaria viridis]TKW14610.1 hypothetical protein SEVIR_5G177650v2 [Setaria viridis]